MAQDGTAEDVDVIGSFGVQAGTGNTQVNNWPSRPPLDPSSLRVLSPHKAAERIRQWPHEDALDVLGRASPADVSHALNVLLETDQALLVSLLADLNPREARELIKSLLVQVPWLEQLPDAAQTISSIAAMHKWDRDPGGGRLRRATQSFMGEDGFIRTYQKGLICWNRRAAFMVNGAIAEHYKAAGDTGGDYAYPVSMESPVESRFGARGLMQDFEGGTIFSSAHGTFGVAKILLACHRGKGGVGGWLGFPVTTTAEAVFGEDRPVAQTQRFEGGAIYSIGWRRVHTVRADLVDYLDSSERAAWLPCSDEADSEISPYGTAGRTQRFRSQGAVDVIVYSSDSRGIHCVNPKMGALYNSLGGSGSWLGFPISDDVFLADDAIHWQNFEGGSIIARPRVDAIAVPADTMELIAMGVMRRPQLGWPTSQEQPIGVGEDRIQFFESGTVTLRDGAREIWSRPESPAPAPVAAPRPRLGAAWAEPSVRRPPRGRRLSG